jgi:hypothetical protein
MLFSNKEFTVKESKNPDIASFFISYAGKNGQAKSYQIISTLKQQHDLVMEFDSTMASFPTLHDTEAAALDLLKSIQSIGIDYRHQQSEAKDTRGMLGIFGVSRKFTAHRIFANISDKMWRDSAFQRIIPKHGVRYYICRENVNGQQPMEQLYAGKTTEAEKKELFSFMIYDCIELGQMGIQTELSKEELQKRLTV